MALCHGHCPLFMGVSVSILSESVDPHLSSHHADLTHWVNLCFKWIYLAFLVLQFVLALGNRPKGEQTAYAITLWVYAFLAVYLLVCSFWLTGKAFTTIPSQLKNKTLPANIQQAVCNENIKIDNFLYNRSYWSNGSWYYRWTADYAVEQQAINNNNTFTVCPNQVSPSASLPTSTTAPTAGGSAIVTTIVSAFHTSSVNTNSAASSTSRTAIIIGAVGGAALTIIAVLGGVYCYRRGKRPHMIKDMPSVFLGQSYGVQPVYGASFMDAEAATQRYSSLSPIRRHHESGESTLPVVHSLSPEQVQSLNPSIGPSYLGNDDFSEVVPYIREDDASTLIPPHDAPAERLPPAYHSSWVSINVRQSNSDPGEGSFAS
ncbi:uncharacterized protein F5147DRAFT_809699 [Suillus discolor]|uniref:Uncharacterized protein n=1 Tax=Suillus discolor TaxID=1912936 RepID=A0A9P7JL45_9AGAM|nr:uncharacterized protein F5147DRAFT_809699 [Suillus discolor]KAG2081111.1 hypothetical protein F5147DRAFT_809699 [Suillus discolor]